jgi:effector-binding domain-containing protein
MPMTTWAETPREEIIFKDVAEQKILVVEYTGEGHIAPYFGRLVAYYNKEDTPFKVLFPLMSIEFSRQNQWVAIAFTGKAQETSDVKIKILPAVKVASVIHKGSYQSLSDTIGRLYKRLYKQKKFPSSKPLRLLYKNSPDDNYPEDLITEIQIPVDE